MRKGTLIFEMLFQCLEVNVSFLSSMFRNSDNKNVSVQQQMTVIVTSTKQSQVTVKIFAWLLQRKLMEEYEKHYEVQPFSV